MPELNIVLVEPEIPQNTGNVARTCAATGAKLHLVGPLGFSVDDRHLKRAGLDYWHLLDVTRYENLADFFARNAGPFYFYSAKARRVYTEIRYPAGCYLIFGKETAGLPEELLRRYPDAAVRIPMRAGARCLNLSNSVALGTYEALRQWSFPGLRENGELTHHRWED